jgi:hypothetical protein
MTIRSKDINYKALTVSIFFFAFFILGTAVFSDYGISWDEESDRRLGSINYDYVFNDDLTLLTHKDRYYGVAFELPLIALEKVFGKRDSRTIYLIRHFMVFLTFFISCIFYYLLCARYFKDWRYGLLSVLFLILNPRIFAHSFYNAKDLVFLSIFIISIYSLINFLGASNIRSAVFHGFTCALCVGIRVLGVLVFFITILSIAISFIIKKEQPRGSGMLKRAAVFVICSIFFIILFWPVLWNDPAGQFVSAFNAFMQFKGVFRGIVGGLPVLYMGEYIKMTEVPWHYAPVWIAITIPLIYTILFLIGICVMVKRFFILLETEDLILLSWCFLPLFAVIVFKSTLYDGWRHLFFIYPAFVIIAVNGLLFLKGAMNITWFNFLGRHRKHLPAIVIIISLAPVLLFMIKHHPYQNVYFNILAGRDYTEIRKNFEMDYWGLSYKQGLEYVVKNNRNRTIRVKVANYPGRLNTYILPPGDRARIKIVKSIAEADYFIGAYRFHPLDYPFKKEVFSVSVQGGKILSVYQLKNL